MIAYRRRWFPYILSNSYGRGFQFWNCRWITVSIRLFTKKKCIFVPFSSRAIATILIQLNYSRALSSHIRFYIDCHITLLTQSPASASCYINYTIVNFTTSPLHQWIPIQIQKDEVKENKWKKQRTNCIWMQPG